jgi:hypothetical protein
VPPHIESLASLLAILPALPCKVLTTVHGNKLTFPVSSGVRNVVAKRFGIVFQLREELLALGINPGRYQETSRCLWLQHAISPLRPIDLPGKPGARERIPLNLYRERAGAPSTLSDSRAAP